MDYDETEPGTDLPAEEQPSSRHLRRTRRPRKWYNSLWLTIPVFVVLGMSALYFLLDTLIMPFYVKSGRIAVVPSVIGQKQEAAVKRLEAEGYEPVQYEVRFDEKIPEGIIIRQTPEAGDETKPGRKVFLIISGGREMAVVPELRGKSLRDAKMLLLRGNLAIGGISYEYTDVVSNGAVFAQSPSPGTKISTSTRVNITVSQGGLAGRVPVPTLTGLTLSEAITKLTTSGLSLGKVTFEPRTKGTPNTIIDQYPVSGELLVEGASVDVFVIREGPPELDEDEE